MVFDVQITDLYGTVLTWTDETETVHDTIDVYSGLEVEMPISDDRSAQITLSLYHPAVANLLFTGHDHLVAALGRMIRIRYRGRTIIWGIVTQPKFSTQNKTVQLTIQGPAYKLRHRELNYSDPIVSPADGDAVQNPSDWHTMKAIVEAAYDTPAQYELNIPDIGIIVENVSGVNADTGFYTQIERGRNNWETLQEVASSAFGGEFDIVPYDPDPDEIPFDTTMRPV